MEARSSAENYFVRRRSEPEYGAAYEIASRRIAMFDDVVRSLDARREELGLSKAELARRADMPPAVVRRLFSQQHKNPTLATLVAIADALELRLLMASSGPAADTLGMDNRDHPASGAIDVPSPASGTRQRTA